MKDADMEDAGQYFQAWAGREVGIRRNLLKWYHTQRRQLPWRGDPSPWSERKAEHRSRQTKMNSDKASENELKHQSLALFFRQLRPSVENKVVIDLEDDTVDVTSSAETFPLSPYGVWVSEVMLQQTQVEVVIPFWTRWMRRFPTIQSLATATGEEVNFHWAGLGFYRRARCLHEGAQHVVAKFGGSLPSSVEELQQIPGVGPYTAGAIASIAFGQPAALVDGNVARVFSRLCAIDLPIKSPALFKLSWRLAQELVDPGDPGAFNQGLMELGATVCTPTNPLCNGCPLRSVCKANELLQAGLVPSVMQFPRKVAQKKRRERKLAVAAVSEGSAWMLVRRPQNGLLAGQLDFPSVEIKMENDVNGLENPIKGLDKATREGAVQRLLHSMAKDFNLHSVSLQPFGVPIEHIFSHERHVMHIFRGVVAARPSTCDVLWLSVSEAEHAGMTSGLQKVFGALTGSSKRKRSK